MAIKLIDEKYNPFPGLSRKEYLCDTDADFENLPEAAPGSGAVSVETGNIQVVNASGNWVAFGEG